MSGNSQQAPPPLPLPPPQPALKRKLNDYAGSPAILIKDLERAEHEKAEIQAQWNDAVQRFYVIEVERRELSVRLEAMSNRRKSDAVTTVIFTSSGAAIIALGLGLAFIDITKVEPYHPVGWGLAVIGFIATIIPPIVPLIRRH